MTFPARLTQLLDAIKNEKDPIKRFAYVQQMDALLVNKAEALRDLVAAAKLLHDNLAEYQQINKIGGYDNQDMRMVREALDKLEEQ